MFAKTLRRQGERIQLLHAHGREMPAAGPRGAASAHAAHGTGGTSASTFLKPEISQKERHQAQAKQRGAWPQDGSRNSSIQRWPDFFSPCCGGLPLLQAVNWIILLSAGIFCSFPSRDLLWYFKEMAHRSRVTMPTHVSCAPQHTGFPQWDTGTPQGHGAKVWWVNWWKNSATSSETLQNHWRHIK